MTDGAPELPNALAHSMTALVVRLRERYPEVYGRLEAAARALARGTEVEIHQQVGLLCRDAFIRFADDIYSPDFAPSGKTIPQDKVHSRIVATLSHFGELAGSDERRALAKKSLAYAMQLHHNMAATREAASRALLMTAVSLGDLVALMDVATASAALVQKYGVYKCPACGSTRLSEEWFGDYDGGIDVLVCNACGSYSEMW